MATTTTTTTNCLSAKTDAVEAANGKPNPAFLPQMHVPPTTTTGFFLPSSATATAVPYVAVPGCAIVDANAVRIDFPPSMVAPTINVVLPVVDTPPPLYIQSEFDLRTVQIAAESAQLASTSLVQSDPNIGGGGVEHSGALFVEMVNTGTASEEEEEPSPAGIGASGGGGNCHPIHSTIDAAAAATAFPDRPPLLLLLNNNNNANHHQGQQQRHTQSGTGGGGCASDAEQIRRKTSIDTTRSSSNAASSFRSRTCSGRRTAATGSRKGRLRNQSELEVNAQHYKMQNVYKHQRERLRTGKLTDIDFEGILKIIGGCSTWQILIYLIISAHQMPHAMFNLSVVYFTYMPDHWCKLPGFSREYIENPENQIGPGWSWEKALDSGIAFPQARNSLRRRGTKHDQCAVYAISEAQLREYLRMNFTEAVMLARERPSYLVHRCTVWEYDRRIMKESVVTQWDRVCDDNWSRAHVHLSYSLGYLVGCLMGGYISDRYGRKPAIYGFSILSTIFGFLLSFSREFEVFLVVRFLLAACNEAADLAAYVYCMEITGMQYRSIVGSLLQAPWACGYAFLALVAYLCRSWTAIQLITSTLHLCALFLIHHLPESPRWLIVTNRLDEAEKIIRKACHFNKSSLPSDLELVRHSEMRKWIKHNQRPHFLHSFKSPTMAFRNVIIGLVWIATALVYYGIVIALSDQSTPGRAMFVGNFFLNNAIAGAIELPTLMTCVFLLHKGRKWSQVISLISAGTLIFAAMCLSLRDEMTFSLLFMLAGKAAIQGAFNILYIFTSELYPTVIRNTAVGTCSMIARIGSAASGYIAILSDVTLPIVPMAIFCIFSLFAGVLIYFLPETRDLPLPETMWDAVRMLNNTEQPYRCVGGIPEEHDDDCYEGRHTAAAKAHRGGAAAADGGKRSKIGQHDAAETTDDGEGMMESDDADDDDEEEEEEEEDVFLYTNVSKR